MVRHHAIGQSINRDCGALSGLTGLKTKRAAMERWFLTAHLKASVATTTKAMLGLGIKQQSTPHKEAIASQVGKDESAVNEICEVIVERMSNPFTLEPEWDSDNLKPLCNIATGLVVSAEICSCRNSSHPSADCSRHSNFPSLFPAPTILVTKYKGFLYM